MSEEIKPICLWSGPRNISTAMMYSFAQRSDTAVFDEPFYGYYLKASDAAPYHPGAMQVIEEQETDPKKLAAWVLNENIKPVLFFKQMTHHLLLMDLDFMRQTINVILTRNPKPMLASFAKVIDRPTMQDVGYQQHLALIRFYEKEHIPFLVIDSEDVLKNPEKSLTRLCEFAGISFEEQMLSWRAGPLPEDGSWAKYWYHNVHQSTGFQIYKEREVTLPAALQPLLLECEHIYQELMTYARR